MRLNQLIAVVEDDDSVRIALVRLLRCHDYRVAAFASAEDFLAESQETEHDCIVADICLPGLSGIDLAQQLASSGRTTPIVMITAQPDAEVQARALRSGALQVLLKPIPKDQLLEAVGAACAKAASQR